MTPVQKIIKLHIMEIYRHNYHGIPLIPNLISDGRNRYIKVKIKDNLIEIILNIL